MQWCGKRRVHVTKVEPAGVKRLNFRVLWPAQPGKSQTWPQTGPLQFKTEKFDRRKIEKKKDETRITNFSGPFCISRRLSSSFPKFLTYGRTSQRWVSLGQHGKLRHVLRERRVSCQVIVVVRPYAPELGSDATDNGPASVVKLSIAATLSARIH